MNKLKNKRVDYKGFVLASSIVAIAVTLLPELAIALPKGPETLALLATDVKKEIKESGLTILLNGAGLAAVGYSVANGLNKAALISGALILIFTNIYFPFVDGTVKPT